MLNGCRVDATLSPLSLSTEALAVFSWALVGEPLRLSHSWQERHFWPCKTISTLTAHMSKSAFRNDLSKALQVKTISSYRRPFGSRSRGGVRASLASKSLCERSAGDCARRTRPCVAFLWATGTLKLLEAIESVFLHSIPSV